jgi:hypothetical protein
MMKPPHFPRIFMHGRLPVFDLVIDLDMFFDIKQWISTPGCAILEFRLNRSKKGDFRLT